jgi:hypothetical protein
MHKMFLITSILTMGLLVSGADKKFSDLTLLPQASWSTSDLIPITDISVPESKKTTIGDFDLRYVVAGATQNANLIYAGPSSGATAAPSFRSLVALDIPNLSATKITSGQGALTTTTTGITIGTGSTALLSNATINIQNASTSQPGLLSSADFTTFNNKQSTVTASAPAVISANNITINRSTTSVDGYLASSDFTTFNNKISAVTSTAPITVTGGTVVGITKSTTAVDGYLASSDFTTFNNKQATVSATAPITFASNTIAIPVATTSVNGYLSSSDFTTFNNKQATVLTTKGDLLTFGASIARLPVGSDTFVLTADSTQTNGIKWAASSAGFTNPMTTGGDLIYGGSGGTATRLANGSAQQVLTSSGGTAAPTWISRPWAASAYVSSTGTVTNEVSDFINGNCTNSAGTATCTFTTSFWSATPNCAVTIGGDVTASFLGTASVSSETTTSVVIKMSTSGVGNTSRDFTLLCTGLR